MLTSSQFTSRVLIVFAAGAALAVTWLVADVILLGFGAVIFAVVVRLAGHRVARLLHVSDRWGSVAVLLFLLTLFIVIGMAMGDEISHQIGELRQRLPEAIEAARQWAEGDEIGQALLSAGGDLGDSFSASRAMSAATATLDALSNFGLVLLIAIYLSLNPAPYVRGTVQLFPLHLQAKARQALASAQSALERWLLGQFASMVSVGVMTAFGLWLVDIPLPLLLGLVAGLLDFVPVLGPIVAAVPGILLAFAQSPTDALYALLVYVVVQQIESAVVLPVAQRWAVHLPPALGLLAIVVFGVLFGVPGILFATPLTVVIMVLVRDLYVRPRNEAAIRNGDT